MGRCRGGCMCRGGCVGVGVAGCRWVGVGLGG